MFKTLLLAFVVVVLPAATDAHCNKLRPARNQPRLNNDIAPLQILPPAPATMRAYPQETNAGTGSRSGPVTSVKANRVHSRRRSTSCSSSKVAFNNATANLMNTPSISRRQTRSIDTGGVYSHQKYPDHLKASNQSTEDTNRQHQAQQLANTRSEIDELRLEYQKFKIISQLGIKSNPDSLKPKMNPELQARLLSSSPTGLMGDQSSERTIHSSRHKRSLACNQVKSDKDACCLENFYVNFTDIGWDKWILYPAGYNANYCRGQCDLSHARYYHSTLLSKFSHLIGLCCSPKQMAPLSLLYIDEDNKVHQKMMPDMIVESCDCA